MTPLCAIETVEDQFRRHCAFHEAGHAVAALAMGRGVQAVSIRSDGPICRVIGEPWRNLLDAMVVVLAGNAAARAELPGDRFAPSLDPREAAEAIVRARARHKGVSDTERAAEYLVAAAGSEMGDQQLVKLWRDLEWLTERYCRTFSWRVWTKRIAERLLKHETLFDYELEDIPRDSLARAMDDCGEQPRSSAPVSNERASAMTERHVREASLTPTSFDVGKNTVDLVWSTGATVRRYSYADGEFDELLDMSTAAVRLGRLNAGAALLNTHNDSNLNNVLGCVVPGSARIANGLGTATVKLSSTPGDAEIVAKIRDGIIRNVSVGYTVHRWAVTPATPTAAMVKRAVDWEPLEISVVPIPADAGSQIRSSTSRSASLKVWLNQTVAVLDDLGRRIDGVERSKQMRIGATAATAGSPAPASFFPLRSPAARAESRRLTLLAQRGR